MEDRLSPANAREIGQKIAQSPFSTELMERVRDVLRKRRLASPDQPQQVIDANQVAEYLDDQLTPELVARIEREFLSSDAALAELAAVHQIIGSLHESVTLEERLRQRLYELDPSGRTDVVRTLTGEAPAAAPQPVRESGEWRPLAGRVVNTRRLPTVAVLVMAFVWLVVVATDPVLFPRGSGTKMAEVDRVALNEDQREAGEAGAPAAGSGAADAGAGQPAPVIPPETTGNAVETAAADVPAPADVEGTTPSTSGPPTGEGDAAPETKPPAVAAADTGSTGTPPTTPDAVPEQPVPASDVAPEVAPVADVAPPVVFLSDPHQATMLVNPETGLWDIARPGGAAAVPPEQRDRFDWHDTLGNRWMAVPRMFETRITIEESGWSCELIGPAIAKVNSGADGTGMTIVTGRARVSRVPGFQDVATFLLGDGSARQEISLSEAKTVVGIEVTPVPSTVAPPPFPDSVPIGIRILPIAIDHRVSLYVVAGGMQLTDLAVGQAVEFQERQAVSWLAMPGGQNTDVVIQDALQPGLTPDWIYPREPVPELESVRSRVATRIAAATSLTTVAEEVSEDRNAQVAVTALGYLAVTRSLGPLVTVLLESEHEEVRRAAIDGLGAACRESEAGFSEVQRQLETRLPMNDADLTLALLYGVSDEQARQTDYCQQLVGLLLHDRLVLRELAAYRMQTIVGDRYGYSADADPGRRREAARRWQRHLDENGGQLLP